MLVKYDDMTPFWGKLRKFLAICLEEAWLKTQQDVSMVNVKNKNPYETSEQIIKNTYGQSKELQKIYCLFENIFPWESSLSKWCYADIQNKVIIGFG